MSAELERTLASEHLYRYSISIGLRRRRRTRTFQLGVSRTNATVILSQETELGLSW